MTVEARRRLNDLEGSVWRFSQTRSGHVLLLLALTLVWTYLWAVLDVLIVGRAFAPPLGPSTQVVYYWIAMWDVLFPLVTLLAFRDHAWFPIAALAVGGWEDILFYWAEGVPVPQDVSWLGVTPTDTLLYLRAAAFLTVALLAEVATHPLPMRRRMAVLWIGVLAVAWVLNPAFVALFALPLLVYVVYANVPEALRTLDRTWVLPFRRQP